MSLLLNTAALDASMVLQARDTIRKEVLKKTQEWLPNVPPPLVDRFGNAMDRFLKTSESLTEPEKLIELLEQFRRYKPMFDPFEEANFRLLRQRFSMKLFELANGSFGAHSSKYLEVDIPYKAKAVQFRHRVTMAGLMLDQVEFERIRNEWNAVAGEWKAKHEAIRQELSEQSS